MHHRLRGTTTDCRHLFLSLVDQGWRGRVVAESSLRWGGHRSQHSDRTHATPSRVPTFSSFTRQIPIVHLKLARVCDTGCRWLIGQTDGEGRTCEPPHSYSVVRCPIVGVVVQPAWIRSDRSRTSVLIVCCCCWARGKVTCLTRTAPVWKPMADKGVVCSRLDPACWQSPFMQLQLTSVCFAIVDVFYSFIFSSTKLLLLCMFVNTYSGSVSV